jgi:hypothetical protein
LRIPFQVANVSNESVTAQISIHRLMGLYCHAIDSGDAELWADCFTADGEYHGIRPDGSDNVIKGRAALCAYAAAHKSPPEAYPKHMFWAPVIAVNENEATAIGAFAVLNDYGSGPVMDVYGAYEDYLVCDDGLAWRFRRRFARVESQSPEFVKAQGNS